MIGWVNIYRSGFYHRAGKPSTFDRHAGDVYPTQAEALSHIHPAQFYVGTSMVEWIEAGLKANGVDSVPRTLAETRREFFKEHRKEIEYV